ncbi:unnamed protein product, partial [Rotaria sordida]
NKGYCPFQVDATNAQSTSTNYTRVAPLASLHNASPQCLNQTTSSSSTFNSSQIKLEFELVTKVSLLIATQCIRKCLGNIIFNEIYGELPDVNVI